MSRKDELYHYGVKGMKWGKRKAIREYLDAKKKGALDRSAKANALKSIKKRNSDFREQYRNQLRSKGSALSGEHSARYYLSDARENIDAIMGNLHNMKRADPDWSNTRWNAKQAIRNTAKAGRAAASSIAKKSEIDVPKPLRPGINRFLDSLPTEKNSVDYNKKQSKIAFNTARRIFADSDAKQERGIPATKERESGRKYLATGYYYAGRAAKKEGSRQEKVYQAIKGTRSKAKSFINKLRKKKR